MDAGCIQGVVVVHTNWVGREVGGKSDREALTEKERLELGFQGEAGVCQVETSRRATRIRRSDTTVMAVGGMSTAQGDGRDRV